MQLGNKRIWSSWWVAGLAMLPTYVFIAVVGAHFGGITWLILMFTGIWCTGEIYIQTVIKRRGFLHNVASAYIYVGIIVIQALTWSALYFSH